MGKEKRRRDDDTDSEERMERRRAKRKKSAWDKQEVDVQAAYHASIANGTFAGIGPGAAGKKASRLYVGNLCYEAVPEQLQAMFAQFGTVRSIQMSHDPTTGRHRGYAFIEFEDEGPAEMAYKALDGYLFGGRSLKVSRPTNPGAAVAGAVPIGLSITGQGNSSTAGSIAAEDDVTVSSVGRVQLMQKLMRKDKNGKDAIQLPKNMAHMPNATAPILTRAPPAAATAPMPSRCIVLHNMVGGPEELDNEIGKELKEECSRYGQVEKICIYDITNPTTSKVDVLFYVMFKNMEGGVKAQTKLNNRKFATRRIVVNFCTEGEFKKIMNEGE